MRRYTLDVGGQSFVVDVKELDADQFEVGVGGQHYRVTLRGDETLPEALIEPGLPAAAAGEAAPRPAPRASAAAPTATPAPARCATPAPGSTVAAPMPGVILALQVQAGDRVERGQPVAVLDAMKMHNQIGAPRAGVVAEVCVVVGQAVGHGDAIVRIGEG